MTNTSPERKKKTSPDYSLIARKIIETSGDEGISKLVAGLYVVATPIGNLGDITLRGLVTLAAADIVACEDTRKTGILLKLYGIKKPLISYHDHNEAERQSRLLQHISKGCAVALVSDAGVPLIADPGYRLVRACREEGHMVTIIPGANAALTALVGSGLSTDRFLFCGFLPSKKLARQKALTDLKSIPATQIFYESPQRLVPCLEDMAEVLGKEREAVVARELTKLYEDVRQGNLTELAVHYRQHLPKGEIVIVLSSPGSEILASIDLDILLQEKLKTLSVRDAVSAVASAVGTKKKDIYLRALQLTQNSKR